MAMTPAERRQRRDANAQSRVNPDTGRPFRNYNELDTWQRNQRAKAAGYTSRSQARYAKEVKGALQRVTERFPRSWQDFLDSTDGRPTQKLAAEFEKAFGRGKKATKANKLARQRLIEELGGDFDWNLWRTEYSSS